MNHAAAMSGIMNRLYLASQPIRTDGNAWSSVIESTIGDRVPGVAAFIIYQGKPIVLEARRNAPRF